MSPPPQRRHQADTLVVWEVTMKRLFIFGAMAATSLGAVGCGAGTIVNQPSTSTPQPAASATSTTAAAAAAHVGATLTLNGTDPGGKLQISLVKIVDPSHSATP
jgi:hypothetical protein